MLRRTFLFALVCMAATGTAAPVVQPVEVRVVVVTMFEIGADSGDAAGEFQLWHERQKLDVRYAFSHQHTCIPAAGSTRTE